MQQQEIEALERHTQALINHAKAITSNRPNTIPSETPWDADECAGYLRVSIGTFRNQIQAIRLYSNGQSMNNPTPDQIKAARLAAGLSQSQAAEIIKASPRSWENWEQGRVKMHPGLFDYFLIKTMEK